jgi:hypothetical protein
MPARRGDGGRRRWWEDRVEEFVELRSTAAHHASRPPAPDPELAAAHRALAEGAWYVLELSRQEPEQTTDQLRQTGSHVLARWQAATEPHDAERWAAADWALWLRDAAPGRWRRRLRRSAWQGPSVGAGAD